MERKSPMPGEIYRHFKNRLYQIVGVATYSESREKLVIYQALYGNFGMYARPYDMFMSEVDHKKYPDVQQKYRFEKVGRAGEEPDSVQNSNADKNITEENSIKDNNIKENNVKENDVENTTIIIEEKAIETNAVNVNNAEECYNEDELPNPDLIAFLDAETYEEKHKLLACMRPRITDRLINDLAASIDVTVEDGDLETRYRSLLYCVKKMDEFEVTRLR